MLSSYKILYIFLDKKFFYNIDKSVFYKIKNAILFISLGRASIILDTQHEGALQKIQYLEDESRYKRVSTEEKVVAEKPQFGRPLKNIERLPEGSSAHLEATLTPVNDPTMKVEWFRNGKPIPQGKFIYFIFFIKITAHLNKKYYLTYCLVL